MSGVPDGREEERALELLAAAELDAVAARAWRERRPLDALRAEREAVAARAHAASLPSPAPDVGGRGAV